MPGAGVSGSGRGGLFGRGFGVERRRHRAKGRAYAVGVSVNAAPSPFYRTKVAVSFALLAYPWRILDASLVYGYIMHRGRRMCLFRRHADLHVLFV